MTVSSTTSRKTYTGNGVTTSFDSNPVVFFLTSDLLVYVVTTATGAATLLTENTHYTVSGGSGTTGTVSLAGGSSPYGAPSALQTLVIVRSVPETQLVDFVNNEATDAEVAEDALDKLTMVCQQLDAAVGRAFALASTDVSGASTVIPTPEASTIIGWNSAGTALQNYAAADISPTILVSTFIETVLDDLTAPAARLTLGLPAIAAKGDLIVGSAADTLVKLAVGTDAYALKPNSGSTSGLVYLPPAKDQPFHNVEISESHAANAVAYTLSGWGGTALSATNPGYIFFPSATLTNPGFTIVKLTANITVTISSGSTLGHASAIAQHSFIYAINNAGTAELAVSTLPPDYSGVFRDQRLISTTAEGGAGASDSASGIYSTTARSNVPWVALAKVKGTQTTAGTWAATPTQIDMAPFKVGSQAFAAGRSGTQAVVSGALTKVQFNAEDFDVDGVYDSATNFRFQPNVAGRFFVEGTVYFSTGVDTAVVQAYVQANGSELHRGPIFQMASVKDFGASVSLVLQANGTSDYFEFFVLHDCGSDKTVPSNNSISHFSGHRV